MLITLKDIYVAIMITWGCEVASLLKELLLDYGMEKLSLEEKADIDSAIDALIRRGDMQQWHKQILLAYAYGYTDQEIATATNIEVSTITLLLASLIYTLASELHIEDDEFVERIKERVPQSKLPLFRQFLKEHYLRYDNHSVRKRQ